jgi:hypothetical protein
LRRAIEEAVCFLLEAIAIDDRLKGRATPIRGLLDALLWAADADGAYSSLGNYPDEEMMNLVGAASSAISAARPPPPQISGCGNHC